MLDECLFSDSWGVLEWGGASGLPSSSLCLALFFLLQRDSGRCGQIRYKLDKHLWIVTGFWSFCARVSGHHEAPHKPELPPPPAQPFRGLWHVEPCCAPSSCIWVSLLTPSPAWWSWGGGGWGHSVITGGGPQREESRNAASLSDSVFRARYRDIDL